MERMHTPSKWGDIDFHPSKLKESDMKNLAESIDQYLELLEDVMIFPEELEGAKKEFQEAIKTSKKLVKKLMRGDKSVFKDLDEED